MRPARARLALVALVLAGCGSSTPVAPSSTPPPRSGFSYAGITHVSWWHDEYLDAAGTEARSRLATTGSTWGGVLVTWYMERRDASEILRDPDRTPQDDAVARAIQDLHDHGLKVMLKPHVDVQDGSWRGTIHPRSASAWFASYAAFITRYAALAEANRVEMLCIGTELATLTDARYASEWAAVIAEIRAAYHGTLVYAANANAPGDEFTSVAFWDLVDLMGLDVYTPLTASDSPSVAELVAGWSSNRYGEDMLAAYRNWQASHGKPVIFTEIGYRSADGTNQAPYDFTFVSGYDPREQADCYQAAFEVWSRESAWMKGVFWWDWAVPAPAADDTDYTPRDKPAEDVLRLWNHQ
jgi:hypothetical protein